MSSARARDRGNIEGEGHSCCSACVASDQGTEVVGHGCCEYHGMPMPAQPSSPPNTFPAWKALIDMMCARAFARRPSRFVAEHPAALSIRRTSRACVAPVARCCCVATRQDTCEARSLHPQIWMGPGQQPPMLNPQWAVQVLCMALGEWAQGQNVARTVMVTWLMVPITSQATCRKSHVHPRMVLVLAQRHPQKMVRRLRTTRSMRHGLQRHPAGVRRQGHFARLPAHK